VREGGLELTSAPSRRESRRAFCRMKPTIYDI